MDLHARHGCHRVNGSTWHALLKLARLFDWPPAGTERDEPGFEQIEPPDGDGKAARRPTPLYPGVGTYAGLEGGRANAARGTLRPHRWRTA